MSAVASIEITGIDVWRRNLSAAAIEAALQRGFRKGLQPTATAAAALAPRRSGTLARSIRVQTSERGGSASGAIVTGAPYGHLVESGHREVVGGRIARSGHFVPLAKRGRLTGQVVGFVPGRHFTTTAFLAHQDDLVAALERELQATIDGGV